MSEELVSPEMIGFVLDKIKQDVVANIPTLSSLSEELLRLHCFIAFNKVNALDKHDELTNLHSTLNILIYKYIQMYYEFSIFLDKEDFVNLTCNLNIKEPSIVCH